MADIVGSLVLLGTGLFVFVLLATVYIAANRYILAPSDKIPVSYTHLTLPTIYSV